MLALLVWSCKREVQDLEASPWEPNQDSPFVSIDSTVHDPGLGAFFMYFYLDYVQVPAGRSFIYANVYLHGYVRSTQLCTGTQLRVVQAGAVSGRTYSYQLEFIELNTGDTTRKFGPFVYSVP